MMSKAVVVVLVALCLVAPGLPAGAADEAADAALARLSWLAGCWASVQGEPGSGEWWTPLAGGSLLGLSRTVRGGRTVAHEFMQIRALPDGRLAFIAQPSGQAQASFMLQRQTDSELVFENPQHDYPQRVIYRLRDGGLLDARIEGLRQGVARAIDFPLRRQRCEAMAAPPR